MLPPNEVERIKALHDLDILQGPSPATFDAICKLARDYFGVGIALISLVDSERQVFKSRCGIDISSTPRDIAFCSHAILRDEIMVVEDARQDPRFSENPLVTGAPYIRFYAGAPLALRSGVRLGTLCLIDQEPRQLDAEQGKTLRRLADLAADALRHRETELRLQAQGQELDCHQSVLAQAEDISPVGLWDYEIESKQLRWSDGVFRVFGRKPGDTEVSLDEFVRMVHADDRPAVAQAVRTSIEQAEPFASKYRIVRPDCQVRSMVSRGDVLRDAQGRPIRIAGIVKDVTERDRAQAALAASEARWRLALQAGGMVAFEVDLETGFTTLSDDAHVTVGVGPAHYQDYIDRIHPDDRANVQAKVEQAMTAGTPYQVEFRSIRPEGVVIWMSMAGALTLRDESGARRLGGICVDITERKKLEASLQESEARFRDFTEISSDWQWETDEHFRYTHIGAPARHAGLPTSEVLGKKRWDIAGADAEFPHWKQHIEDWKALRPFRDFEFQLINKAGEPRSIVSSGRPYFDGNGRFLGYRGTSSDQTERKKLEAQLQQALKMEAIGHLTGGIAHDFNNLLTIVLGNAEILAEDLWAEPELQALAHTVLSAAKRGAELTNRLLTFARRQTLESTAVSVNAVVEGMTSMLRRTLGEQVVLRTELADNLPPAFVDSALLEMAILNLAVNARDAMPKGGALTIATKSKAVKKKTVDLEPGKYIVITVRDTGHGMTPEVLRRVFEPFFTTKEVGKGSGLGLPMTYGFAKQSGGTVSIRSAPGHGTSVRLVLPQAQGIHLCDEQSPDRVAPPSGTERILVVEDEEDVRRFVVGQLAHLGYATEEAADGPSALELLRSGNRFDLLFTDIVLPEHMSGLELAEEARKIDPDLSVVFTSGYSTDVLAQEGVAEPAFRLLRKPYGRHDLAITLRQALANS